MAEIESKIFTRRRMEWWVPTGTYHGDGARVEELNKAISWAQNALQNHEIVVQRGQAPLTAFDFEGHIRTKPHDEHVIVYIEFDEEEK